ncbi:tRNA 2-thiouridine(34) synthase MnmA [Candidatus Woesearchaeota archaeon]|nr:MAG: tRNA 2-thiouridine(34) synthase MnmA [Candidatus Woesearchaeota archaeon]
MKEKVVVGMSGGVDSSVALMLLKKQGFEPVGVSLKLPVWQDKCNRIRDNICCSEESLRTAKSVCKKFGVPYHIIDVQKEFKKEVIEYLKRNIKQGRTPNPCVICNRHHKFRELLRFADKHRIKYVATGHYAKVVFDKKSKKYLLKRPKDKDKDQTYGLSFLTQKQLSRILLPLGNLTKEEVFKIAEKEGFEVFLKKKESQDFCFVSNKSFSKFIEKEIGVKKGKIIDVNGRVLGEHKGMQFFTIGQKKGLNLPGTFYVVKKKGSSLVVSKDINDTYSSELILSRVNFISGEKPAKPINVRAKIRYRQKLSPAKLVPLGNKFKIVFKKPQHAITPGQFCVFYEKDVCLGAGIIA